MVQAQNQLANRLVASAAINLDQFLDRFGQFILPGVVFLQFFIECFVGQQARLASVEHGELRIEAKFVEMFAHEFEAKAMERADVRGVEERQLLGARGVESRMLRVESFSPMRRAGAGAFRRRRLR